MRTLERQIKLGFLVCFILLATLPCADAQNTERAKIDVVGYYFVEDPQVEQDSQSAAITLTISDISDRETDYPTGLQVVFITQHQNGNAPGDVDIRINALPVKSLLTRRGVEYIIGELDAGIIITATYDGTDFRSDFDPPPEFRFAEPNRVTRTGDAYTVTDTSLPPVATSPLLLGIKAKATNTGNVTLSINGSTEYPIYFSNGEQITAGALENGRTIFCSFTNIGGVGFRAINLHAARSLKGRLVATATLPAAAHADDTYVTWAIPTGITELSAETLPGGLLFSAPDAIDDALLLLPDDRFSNSQLGWFIEITKGTSVVSTRLELFGYTSGFGLSVKTSDDVLDFIMSFFSRALFTGISKTAVAFRLTEPVTTTEEYVISVYVTEN